MKPLTIDEMQELQLELRRAYEDDWGPLCPEVAAPSLLWTVGEIGEVIDIIKKEGEDAIINDPETHAHFTEEVCDVLMHLTDMLICLKVAPEEVAESFRNKQQRNLRRWKDD